MAKKKTKPSGKLKAFKDLEIGDKMSVFSSTEKNDQGREVTIIEIVKNDRYNSLKLISQFKDNEETFVFSMPLSFASELSAYISRRDNLVVKVK